MPNYKTNAPKGYRGDPSRGAAMGRDTIKDAPRNFNGKIYLKRKRLNGDYDENGTYFGNGGGPLWWAANEDLTIDFMLRAENRDAAKAKVLESYPKARFYR